VNELGVLNTVVGNFTCNQVIVKKRGGIVSFKDSVLVLIIDLTHIFP
jgi:hypothetical protein